MRVLVTAAKVDFNRLKPSVAMVRKKMSDTAQVVSGEDVPWDSILETEGSWDGVFAWVARSFDALIVIETDEGGLGRGTYELVNLFLNKGSAVGVARDGGISEVTGTKVFDKKNWTTNYGILVTK